MTKSLFLLLIPLYLNSMDQQEASAVTIPNCAGCYCCHCCFLHKLCWQTCKKTPTIKGENCKEICCQHCCDNWYEGLIEYTCGDLGICCPAWSCAKGACWDESEQTFCGCDECDRCSWRSCLFPPCCIAPWVCKLCCCCCIKDIKDGIAQQRQIKICNGQITKIDTKI